MKVSYLSSFGDVLFSAATLKAPDNPFDPIGLLIQGCQGVVIVANIPDADYQKLVDAVDSAFDIKHVFMADSSCKGS